jgi:hypothetical protein
MTMIGLLLWSLLFWITEPKPALRSYWSGILLTIVGYLGFFFPSFTLLGADLTFGYYLLDIILLVRSRKDFLYIVHHAMTLAITLDTIWESQLPWGDSNLGNMSLISGLMNSSTIFLGWKEMAKDRNRYFGWYPDFSFETCRQIFGFSFLFFRVILGVPIIVIALLKAAPVTQFGLCCTLAFTVYWTIEIAKNVLKLRK